MRERIYDWLRAEFRSIDQEIDKMNPELGVDLDGKLWKIAQEWANGNDPWRDMHENTIAAKDR